MSEVDALEKRRLFIGRISKELALDKDDLRNRLSKFAQLESELEIHEVPVKQQYFAYINVVISAKNFSKLKNALSNVTYKGSKLVIDIAKEDYTKSLEKDRERPGDQITAKMLKHEYEHFKKLRNISMSYVDRQEIIPGRIRRSPRKDFKKMTFRVTLNDKVRILKCHKTKLWGYEKNKSLRELVYKYSNQIWRDGNDHIVERAEPTILRKGSSVLKIEPLTASYSEKPEEQQADEDGLQLEMEKNNKVLASLLNNYDFNKPLDFREDVGVENADSDYEYDHALKDEDEDEDGDSAHDLQSFADGGLNGEPARTSTITFDVEERDSDSSKPLQVYNSDDDEIMAENTDEDVEFIPTFGQVPADEKPTIMDGTLSNTETLRDLFNTNEQSSGFKLLADDYDDIDTSKVPVADAPVPEMAYAAAVTKPKKTNGLFFSHFDSPFLVAQTQLNKLSANPDFEGWEESFWQKRGERTREFKRRKRDVLRQIRKKNAKNTKVLI